MSKHRGKLHLEFGTATWDLMDTAVVGDRAVPRAMDIEFVSVDSQPSLQMRIEVRDGVPLCVKVEIEAAENGREVRSVDLRAVRIEDWVEDIVSAVAGKIEWNDDGHATIKYARTEEAERAAARAIRQARATTRGNVQKRLPEVAEVYRRHFEGRPVEAVGAAFGVSYRTAGRYVQLCRDAGLLPPTTPGKKNA